MKINEILQKLNEFLRKDAGEEIPFKNAADTIDKLKKL